MRSNDEEVAKLIQRLKKPIRNVSFGLVIKAATEHEITPLTDFPDDKELIKKIRQALMQVTSTVNETDFRAKYGRPNEFSNAIEPYLIAALKNIGLKASIPKTVTGKMQAAGYPNIEVKYGDRTVYIECKAVDKNKLDVSLRSFYYKPTVEKRNKVTSSGNHLLAGFLHTGKTPYQIVGWHLVDMAKVRVSLKPEFNANNPQLYRKETIIESYPVSGCFE